MIAGVMRQRLVGRTFWSPVLDYLLIGGGLSLLVFAGVMALPGPPLAEGALIAWCVLFSNSAHFASSTVRLYSKPGAFRDLPFLTLGFPLVTLAVLLLGLEYAESLGQTLQSLYLTWSPYHYAAQSYGLAVMYGYRSGCLFTPRDKKLLWWVCMLPFFHTFLFGSGTGLSWLLPGSVSAALPAAVSSGMRSLYAVLPAIGFAAPLALFAWIWRSKSGPMPLISLLIILTNGVWWFLMMPMQAFVWATVFHGIQYLAIVTIFHNRDRDTAAPRWAWFHRSLPFYGACLLLGYGLFSCLPIAGELFGYGAVESLLVVAAVINLHHFIVDGFIWRLKKSDSNRRIVDQERPAVA